MHDTPLVQLTQYTPNTDSTHSVLIATHTHYNEPQYSASLQFHNKQATPPTNTDYKRSLHSQRTTSICRNRQRTTDFPSFAIFIYNNMILFTFGSAAILILGLVSTANGDCEFAPTTNTLLHWKIITTNCKPTHSMPTSHMDSMYSAYTHLQVHLLYQETVKLSIEEDVLNQESTPLTLDVESPSKSTVT